MTARGPIVHSWLGPVVMTLLVVFLVAMTLGAQAWKRDLRVVNIRTEGNRIVSTAEIIRLADIQRNAKLFDVNLASVRQRLRQNHFIHVASVNRNVPDGITIAVVERLPVAALLTDKLLFLDVEGTVLPPARAEDAYDLPVITGRVSPQECVPGRIIAAENVQEALHLLSIARAMGEEVYGRISEVHMEDDRELLLYTSESGIPVLVGEGNLISKLVRFDEFWKQIVSQRGAQEVHSIDLRFEDQVVVRWK